MSNSEKSQKKPQKIQKKSLKTTKNAKNNQNSTKFQENVALVLKKEADRFWVEFAGGQQKVLPARKNLKKEGVFVGDYVVVEDEAVSCVKRRKNLLVRPPIANLDRLFVVVAPVPQPDLYTVDKLLLFCKLNNIKPILCINKFDLDEKVCKSIKKTYQKLAKTLIFSTFDESVKKMLPEIKGICAMAGQSAVGKSSIINALKENSVAKVDSFSKKILRGKQTTRVVQLYEFSNNNFLADTAGFSKLDERLLNVQPNELKSYYPDFLPYAEECKYLSCLHLGGDCGVLKAVQEQKISVSRYENYKKLLKNLQILSKMH